VKLRRTIAGDHAPPLPAGVEFDEVGHCASLTSVNYTHRIDAKQHIYEFEVKIRDFHTNREIFPNLVPPSQPTIGNSPPLDLQSVKKIPRRQRSAP
jgi:hypothetical protein